MVLRVVYTSVIEANRQKWLHTAGDRFPGFRQQAGQPKSVLPTHMEKQLVLCPTQAPTSICTQTQ